MIIDSKSLFTKSSFLSLNIRFTNDIKNDNTKIPIEMNPANPL